MKHRPLSESNPYLKDKNLYEKFLVINVSSSATIELGELPTAMKKALQQKRLSSVIYITPEIEKDFSQ